MNLDFVFKPASIAIVGASTKEGSVGNDLVKNLATLGFEGTIYPVNPKAEELYGHKCYPSMTEIGEPIDLMLIAVPAAVVPHVLEEGGKLGIKGAVIISAGFKEAGNHELETQVKEICAKHDIALIGPNCLGVINPEIKMNASFAAVMPKAGPVGLASQSGALCTALIDYANEMGIGFSKFMSIGNKAVLDELSIFEYLHKDPKTKVMALYAEDLRNAEDIIEFTNRANRGDNPKPIIILKSGRTSAGASASASHTGALAGSDAAYDALFRQAGVVRAQSVSQLFNFAQAFAYNPLPAGKRIAIITNAGGPGVLTTDEAISNGLELAKLEDETIASLKAFLPAAANTHNPIDVLGDAKAESYQKTLELVSKDNNVDGIIVLLTPQSMTEIEATAEAVVAVKKETKKPIIVSFMGDVTVKPGVAILQRNNVAACSYPEQAARSMAALVNFATWQKESHSEKFAFDDIDRERVKEIFKAAQEKGQTAFPEAEALEILRAYNFPLLRSRAVQSAEEAARVAPTIGDKMAMKIISPDILHKSDVGGVWLNITPQEAGVKYDEMIAQISERCPKARLEGILFMEMAPKGHEFILGSSTDPALGQMVMVGLGGIYVEVLKDVTFGLTPLTKNDAKKMLEQIKSKKIFEGVRGEAALDVPALVECVGRLSQLLTDFPEIVELDVNPLLILPKGQGVRVLDARIVIK